MKCAAPSKTARELDSITASFVKVRLLHCASAGHTTAAAIAEQLHQHGARGKASQTLASLSRDGLLKVKPAPGDKGRHARQYSLTPKGRRLLAAATKHLRQLAAP